MALSTPVQDWALESTSKQRSKSIESFPIHHIIIEVYRIVMSVIFLLYREHQQRAQKSSCAAAARGRTAGEQQTQRSAAATLT